MPIRQEQIQSAKRTQDAAAHDASNQVRLIAGPGTGKSFAIVERVYWLLRRQIAPSRIFVVSFTRASARDLRKRIERYCIERGIQTASSVSVTTLHSLALRMLRAAGLLAYPSDPIVMDRWELRDIFDTEFSNATGIRQKRCEEIRCEHEAFWSTGQWGPPNYIPPNPPISENERTTFIQFHNPRTQTYSCVLPGEIVRQCVQSIASGTLDPVSQLRIEHLIVDEFQDLNPCDLEFVDHIIQRDVVTFVAGDDDQSIYSFRFASPHGIQCFTSLYTDAGDHEISDCFRCTPAVVRTAFSVINSHPVPNRIPKTLNSLYSGADPPLQGLVVRWKFPSGIAEAQAIADSCRDLIQAGIPPREILILLSNTRILDRDITNALNALEIPHERPKSTSYIESPEGRFALNLLRITCNRNDYVAHRSILGLLPGIGVQTCNNIANKVVSNNLNFVNLFYHPLPEEVFSARELTALNRVRSIITSVEEWQTSDSLVQRNEDIMNILETQQGSTSQQMWSENTSHLPEDINLEEIRDYLWADTDEQEAGILESVYQRLGLPIPTQGVLPPRIRVMTMHGVKGLSARVVFIPGLEEEILPGQWRIPYPGLVLEAARLLYMSVSRARISCILTFARNRIVYGRYRTHAPSRFTRNLNGTFIFRRSGGLSEAQINNIIQECNQI